MLAPLGSGQNLTILQLLPILTSNKMVVVTWVFLAKMSVKTSEWSLAKMAPTHMLYNSSHLTISWQKLEMDMVLSSYFTQMRQKDKQLTQAAIHSSTK